jgi:hypothetical protein
MTARDKAIKTLKHRLAGQLDGFLPALRREFIGRLLSAFAGVIR